MICEPYLMMLVYILWSIDWVFEDLWTTDLLSPNVFILECIYKTKCLEASEGKLLAHHKCKQPTVPTHK